MGFLPKIHLRSRSINTQKESLKTPSVQCLMTATSTIRKSDIRFLGLPKNRTGVFAADTIHEVKPTRNSLVTVPALSPQFRQTGSTSYFFATSEQNHHQLQQYRSSKNEIQQYYPIEKPPNATTDSSNDSRLTSNGVRNGFRPSAIRHQKLRLTTTASSQRTHTQNSDNRDFTSKSQLTQSQASARLRSEIDHLNAKIIKNRESTHSFRLQNSRELDDSPPSALSYSTSYRGTSASTTFTVDRIHQRFSSAITNPTSHARPNPTDTSNLGQSSLSPIAIHETDENEGEDDDDETVILDYRTTHAYQIPQQTNVGSESIFLNDPSTIGSIKTHSTKSARHSNEMKSLSCPFYVMYFTNLAMQQRQTKENNIVEKENERPTLATSSITRKVPVNSRISTAIIRRPSSRKPVNSPISMSTHSTADEDERLTNVSSTPHSKRYTTRISPIDEDNSISLRDILRTSSWNHVHV